MLGRLSPEHFLGGQATLTVEPVRSAIQQLAEQFSMSPTELAQGVLRVANATMERAIRVISLERGFDPRDFTLVCFGGAGGMHAADLARNLGIPRVLIPKGAGALSALGMLLADFVRDYSKSVLRPTGELSGSDLDVLFAELESRAAGEYEAEGLVASAVTLTRSFDMRYVGQGFELAVDYSPDYEHEFHRAHERRYGYADESRPTEIVNVRVRAVALNPRPPLPTLDLDGPDPRAAQVGEVEMVFGTDSHQAPLYNHDLLAAGNRFRGPALIVEYSTTTTVPPDFSCLVDIHHNLILEPS